MPGKIEMFQAIVGGLKSYDDAKAQGREDLATQAYQEVMTGINALSGITGVRGDIQRMRIERAEEARRGALHPAQLRREEAAAEQAELTSEQMQMQLEEQRKTIEALRARLQEVGAAPTVEAMRGFETIEELIAAQKARRPEARVGAEVAGLTAEQLAAEVQRRMREEELAREVPERRVEVEEAALAAQEKRAGYEQMVIDWQVEEGVPEATARSTALMASRTLDQADANIKLTRRNARLAKTRAEALDAQMEADRLQREAMAEAGLELGDMMITKSKIEAGLLPDANQALDKLRDAMRIWTTIKTQPAGRIDPLDIALAEKIPSARGLIQQMLPSPVEREEAMKIMADYVNSQKAILRQLGINYDELAESAVVYERKDLDTVRSDEKIEYTAAMGLSAPDITDRLDTFSLRLLNDPNLMRDDVLELIESNMTEGQNLNQIFGQANMEQVLNLLKSLQGVTPP